MFYTLLPSESEMLTIILSRCRISGCPRGEKEYPTEDAFRKHLLDKHRTEFSRVDHEKLEAAVNWFKIVVR